MKEGPEGFIDVEPWLGACMMSLAGCSQTEEYTYSSCLWDATKQDHLEGAVVAVRPSVCSG
jgi:hypothetical protein